MKINDLNKIEEGLASSLFGEVPVAAIKGLFTGKGTKTTLEQDFFIKDFVGDAIASLDNGIRGGLVNPNIAPAPTASDPANTNAAPNNNTNQTTNVPKDVQAANRVPDDIQENIKYKKLNAIFESIIEATGGQSISKYMTSWFNKYMGGVDWTEHKEIVIPLIQAIENSYKKDKGKAAIKKLAQAAYGIAKTAKTTPAGAKNAVDPSASSQTGETPAAASAMKDIKNSLPNMRLRDLQSLKKTVDAVIATKAKRSTTKAAPTAPVSESKRPGK
jgi:hypothetical protein